VKIAFANRLGFQSQAEDLRVWYRKVEIQKLDFRKSISQGMMSIISYDRWSEFRKLRGGRTHLL
jgi:hypothetical protein